MADTWFEEIRAFVATCPHRPGLSARIQLVLTGAAGGDVRYDWVLVDGYPNRSGSGEVDDPELSITSVREDVMAITMGDLDPSVAFMQGKLKVTGSMGIMMRLLAVLNSPECQDLRGRIADITEF